MLEDRGYVTALRNRLSSENSAGGQDGRERSLPATLIYLIVDMLRSRWGVGRPGENPAGHSPVDVTGTIDLCVVEQHHETLTRHAALGNPFPMMGGVFIGR